MKIPVKATTDYNFNDFSTPQDIVAAFRAAMYEQREGLEHTLPYHKETLMLYYVKTGNLEELKKFMASLDYNSMYIGRLSKDPLRQMQYSIVAGITMITRSAIEGGLPEIEAYNLSDVYIHKMDALTSIDEIGTLFNIAIYDFTRRVGHTKSRSRIYSYPITLCAEYINSHLHYPITLMDLSDVCKLSSQYLSTLFKKETGRTLTDYILEERLETSKQMLTYSDYSLSEIATNLAFCSHSNYTEHFRKQYGITPREYRDSSRTFHRKEETNECI